MPDGRPNLVLIMSDQHNPHVMGCAGNDVVRTPNLDALARDGVRFTSACCPSPLCVPSRMGFLAAQYPGDVDVWGNGNMLDSRVRTFAHHLADAGYETVLCGRMHFVGPDQRHGFERRLYGDCWHFLSKQITGHGYHRTNGQTRCAVEVSGHGRAGYEVFDGRVTEKACEFIATRGEGERPYCMVVGGILPHNPLICERELFECYMERVSTPEVTAPEALAKLHPAIRAWRERRGVDDISPVHARRARAAYCGLVTQMDRNVGRVLDAVGASPGADDTVVLYTSDHGDLAGEHGMWWKSNYYEGSVGVPLIVSSPARFAGGRTVDAVVNLIDLGPTLLDLAGAEPMRNVSGRSLAAFLTGTSGPDDWPNETFSEYAGAHGDAPSCMVRSGPWKLMYYSEFDSYLLFNLDEDPGERVDRATDPACRDVGEALLAKIRARWSAERVLAGNARQHTAVSALSREERLGDDPHLHETPPDDANVFDFSQIPGWDAIRRHFETA
ncbi:MAG TPA: sulfatase-like hydrolase/transferase [Planctomycetota bacterium]|nr:sulfatase-like hydrolase/transferase [Planctomycetota bacterium]